MSQPDSCQLAAMWHDVVLTHLLAPMETALRVAESLGHPLDGPVTFMVVFGPGGMSYTAIDDRKAVAA